MDASNEFTGPQRAENIEVVPFIFPFLKLPAELRDHVYFHSTEWVDPNDPVVVPTSAQLFYIPAIADLSRQTRKEALQVLSRATWFQFDLRSHESLERVLSCLNAPMFQAVEFSHFVFTGNLFEDPNISFRITMEYVETPPYYTVVAQPGVTIFTNKIMVYLCQGINAWLKSRLLKAETRATGRLSSTEVAKLISQVIIIYGQPLEDDEDMNEMMRIFSSREARLQLTSAAGAG